MAHLFTDIKFEGGILGLAYVGSPRRNSVGGICTPGDTNVKLNCFFIDSLAEVIKQKVPNLTLIKTKQ